MKQRAQLRTPALRSDSVFVRQRRRTCPRIKIICEDLWEKDENDDDDDDENSRSLCPSETGRMRSLEK